MNASQARDHLQFVDGILRHTDRSLHMPPVTLIVWGLFGTVVNAVHQARTSGLPVPSDAMVQAPMMLLAIAATVWAAARQPADRETLTDRHAGVVFCVVFFVLLLVNLTAQHTVIPVNAMALFWTAGFSMALLIVGIQGHRALLAGGVGQLLVCMAAPSMPGWFDGLLAAGWFAGFVVPGTVMALGRGHGRTVSV